LKNIIVIVAMVIGLLSIGFVMQADVGNRIVPVASPTLIATSDIFQ